ncbi:MAG: hypothetical protein RDV48_28045 [Candidatus Eremiobacteraeota bacterium]|nr:hypothetical protein [Candidatus Eremiobacteraeota bacterium]
MNYFLLRNMSSQVRALLVCLCLVLVLSVPAWAGDQATHNVYISVPAIDQITVQGDPGIMEVFVSLNQSGAREVIDSSSSYSFFTNAKRRKITGTLDQNAPSYTMLKVNLAAPPGGTSLGDVSLSSSPKDLVVGVGKRTGKNLTITYKFAAEKEAGRVPLTRRTVTYTLCDE